MYGDPSGSGNSIPFLKNDYSAQYTYLQTSQLEEQLKQLVNQLHKTNVVYGKLKFSLPFVV